MTISLPQIVEALKQNKKVVIINAGIIGGILVLGLYFFIFPLRKEIKELETVKESNEKVLAAQKTIMSNKKLKERMEKLNIAIPDNPDTLKIGSTIQALALKNGLLLKSLSFQQDEGSERRGGIPIIENQNEFPAESMKNGELESPAQSSVPAVATSALSFSVEVVGSRENFKKLLQNLETNLRLIDVVDVNMPIISKSSNEDYRLELKAYYAPLNAP